MTLAKANLGAVSLLATILAVGLARGGPPDARARSASSLASASAPASRPNIIIIMTDDQRGDTLGCTGHPFIKTPRLDRVATEGALFENFFVVTPKCCPARATLLTGQYTHRSGVPNNSCPFHGEASETVPGILKRAGYETAFMGKWHIGPSRKGFAAFDHWVAYISRSKVSAETDQQHSAYIDESFSIDGRDTPTTGYSTDVLADYAVDWIRRPRSRPFFLLLCPRNPHFPYTVPPRYRRLYEHAPIVLPPAVRDSPSTLPSVLQAQGPVSPHAGLLRVDPVSGSVDADSLADLRRRCRRYARMMSPLDDAMGRIDDALREQGLFDNTVVIFTSDNGFMLGEHGIVGKAVAYDPAVHVPLLIRAPRRVPAGVRIKALTTNIDLAPTLLAMSGATVPGTMDGRDLLPLVHGSAGKWREDFLMIAPYRPQTRPSHLAVRGTEWKYVRYMAGAIEEQLFDMRQDPGERNNLAGQAEQRDVLDRMRNRMRELMSQEDVPADWFWPFDAAPDEPADPDDE